MSKKQTDPKKQKSADSVNDYRELFYLAIILILGTFLTMGIVIALVFFNPTNTASQTILTAVLPLLGSWVGAVIAFYFSSKNLESATKSVQSIVGGLTGQEKLKTISIKDKMIRRDQIHVTQGDDDSKLFLCEMLNDLEDSKKGDRIPVLSSKEYPKYVIHRSTIDKFLSNKAINEKLSLDQLSKLSLADLVASQTGLARSFGVVSENSTLGDAKSIMDALGKECQDIFVTQKGASSEPVVGWITNIIIEDNSIAGAQTS
jgi:hypothetical protein